MISPTLYSSRSEEWPTPQDFFDKINLEFNFTLDPCATKENAKCEKFFTKEDQGLIQDWGKEVVFCNPPYGKDMRMWARKCYEASLGGGYSRPLSPLTDRHALVPRLGLWQGRTPVYQRTPQVRRWEAVGSLPFTTGYL